MPRRDLRVLVLALVLACGGARAHESFLGMLPQPPTLLDGRVQQLVQIELPDGGDPTECRLTWEWRGPSTSGAAGPIAPTETSTREASWRVAADVGAIDVVAVRGHVRCGALERDLGERWAGTRDAEARYCELCAGERSAPTAPAPARDRDRPGIEVHALAGMAIEGRGTVLVDRCREHVLLDLSDVPGAVVAGGTDRESELARLLASDRGQDACDAIVPGAVQIEVPASASGDVASRLSTVPGVSAVLSLPPMPG